MKKFSCLLVTMLLCVCVFAQNVVSAGLKDSDVKNFAKNYDKIQKEFEKYGDMSDEELYAMSLRMGADAENNFVEKALEKYGISGPNRILKISMIGICYGVIKAEKELKNLDEQTKQLYKSMGLDPIATYQALVNADDLKVVRRNAAVLEKILD